MKTNNRTQHSTNTPLLHLAILAVTAAIISGAISGCRPAQSGDEPSEIPTLTVSIPPLEYFAEAIGGDSVEVNTLLPAGADPETFEPGINVMRSLATSGALATTGTLRFEEALVSNLRTNNPSLRTFPMSDGIELIYGTHEHHHHEDGHAHENGKEEPDPHTWSSVKNARIIASNMLAALTEIAPAHKDYYTSRYNALLQHLDSLDTSFATRIHNAGISSFLIWHPSLSYFARDYGLRQIAFNVENKETSPLQLQASLRQAAGNAPSAFFIPEGTDSQAASVAAETGLSPVPVNLMSADWERSLRIVADALSDNLQRP